jgi:hypothetical protein
MRTVLRGEEKGCAVFEAEYDEDALDPNPVVCRFIHLDKTIAHNTSIDQVAQLARPSTTSMRVS